MVRLVVYLLAIAAFAGGLSWLADRPGTLNIAWQGYDIETTVFRATIMIALAMAAATLLWSVLRAIWNSPSIIGERFITQRKKKGLDSLSSGLIAIGAGDAAQATRHALAARKSLPYEPLTHLLRAQAAELSGDRATARRIYESMLASSETEQLGLRGLFLEAEREGAGEAARQFAARALRSNPKLGWSASALFESHCKDKNWAGALEALNHAKRNGHIEISIADRRRAVLLTAQALASEDDAADSALTLAMEAHALAPDLAPAAAVAGRIFASRGQTSKAAKVLQKTWTKSPHPDLASAYAYARIGDSARDRLDRVRQLAALNPHSIESPIAVANTAIEARLFNEARSALEPLLENRLTQRVAMLMARIEAGETGEKGRVREWLARAASVARDPVWMADGVISDRWEPISPVTGKIDAYQWRVPVDDRDQARAEIIASRIEELLAIGTPSDAPTNESPDAAELAEEDHRRPSAGRSAAADAGPKTVTIVPPARSTSAVAPISTSTATKLANAVPTTRPAAAGPDSKLFVTPRAPDDPGPEETADGAVAPISRRPFRAAN
ncbi:MAG: heme biosynthesis protein HemY [Hyphomicrobium sp.]